MAATSVATRSDQRSAPVEAWLLLGSLEGRAVYPGPLDDVAGVPAVLRLAAEAAMAGATRVRAIWRGNEPAPDISRIVSDPRLARASLELVTSLPAGNPDDSVLVIRGDRVFHRDLPKQSITAWRSASNGSLVAKVDGREHDAVWVCSRETAVAIIAHAGEPRGLSAELDRREAAGEVATSPVPYLGFTTPVADARG